MIGKFLDLFRLDTSNKELVRAQAAAFSRQMPLLYLMVIANASALSFTHYNTAPLYLTVLIPVPLMLVSAMRAFWWYKTDVDALSTEELAARLHTTFRLAGGLAALFFVWAVSLYFYGDARMQGHVTFFVGLTMISCIFCMFHVRQVALVTTLVVSVPFTIFMFATQQQTYMAIALNIIIVVAAMTYIVNIISGDFERMINSQTEMKRLSDENASLANIDSLTGLPNRRQFFTRLNAVVEEARRDGRRFAVAVLDLDGFKPVNDLYGHVAGDAVLMETGCRLAALGETRAFIARLGGDEFGLIFDATGDDDIAAFGDRICAAIKVPYALSGFVAHLSGSIGFAVFPEAAATAELLYERADYALYNAKNTRRGRPELFSQAHEDEIRAKGRLEQCLLNADLEAEMSLHFQPLFDTDLMRPTAFEALARWNSPELGSVPPNIFIDAAERADMISQLTQALLRKALAVARHWPEDVRMSFNLSARDLMSSEAILQIVAIVNDSGVPPKRIDFEVTETSMMSDFAQAQESLNVLKALGAHISLDDFGTGYSSLSYVQRLPLDKIKIDRSFIQDIETRVASRKLVKSVIDLCHSLQIACVIEGVETKEQAHILRELGCTTMQGYFFSRPIPQDQVAGYMGKEPPALFHAPVRQSIVA